MSPQASNRLVVRRCACTIEPGRGPEHAGRGTCITLWQRCSSTSASASAGRDRRAQLDSGAAPRVVVGRRRRSASSASTTHQKPARESAPHTNRTPRRPPDGKCFCPEEDQPPMTTGSRAIGCDSLAALKSAILRINHPRGRRIDAAPAAAARGRRATPRPRAGFSSNRRRGARARARRTRRRAAPRATRA